MEFTLTTDCGDGPAFAAGLIFAAVVSLGMWGLILRIRRAAPASTERRVAASVGLSVAGRVRMTGEFEGRYVEVSKSPLGACVVRLALAAQWDTAERVQQTSWFRTGLADLLRADPRATLAMHALEWVEPGWPPKNGEHFGALELQTILRGALALASQLDALLRDAAAEWERRPAELGALGLKADSEGRFAGSPRDCDVVLSLDESGMLLRAPLGPGWPRGLAIESNGAWRSKFGATERLGVPGMSHVLLARAAAAEQEQGLRLFAHGGAPFLASVERLWAQFPAARIENGWLELPLGDWDVRASEVSSLLGVITDFLQCVQRFTDWPEKREAVVRRRSTEARRGGVLADVSEADEETRRTLSGGSSVAP